MKLATATALTLALIGSAHADEVVLKKRLFACEMADVGMEDSPIMLNAAAEEAKANAHRKPYESPVGSSHQCRWFDAHPVTIVMTTPPGQSSICVTDDRGREGDRPCYWVKKTSIRD